MKTLFTISAKLMLLMFTFSAQISAAQVALDEPCSILCTEDQFQLEALALRVLNMSAVRKQRETSRAVYANDPVAQTRAGQATLESALDSITMAMLQWAVNDDPARPKLFWVTTAAHRWMGHHFPNSGYGIENPDNVYRHAPIDGRSRYEIRGIMPKNPPAQQSFTVYATLPGMGEMNREGSMILGALDRVKTADDGSFVVTIDRDAPAGRPNHIQSGEQTALLIIRDTLTDWQEQSPVKMTIHRVDGPKPGPVHDENTMARRAAWMIARAVPFWAQYNALIYQRPVNSVPPPTRRSGGWAIGVSGHFKLTEQQALVVTLDPSASDYLGFQLADPWGVGLEYVGGSGSLNLAQVKTNNDNTISYVISRTDPGVYNWLDTSGLDQGIFAIRWQGVPEGVTSGENLVRDVNLVLLSRLGETISTGTQAVTPAARAQQLAQRKLSFERRLRE